MLFFGNYVEIQWLYQYFLAYGSGMNHIPFSGQFVNKKGKPCDM